MKNLKSLMLGLGMFASVVGFGQKYKDTTIVDTLYHKDEIRYIIKNKFNEEGNIEEKKKIKIENGQRTKYKKIKFLPDDKMILKGRFTYKNGEIFQLYSKINFKKNTKEDFEQKIRFIFNKDIIIENYYGRNSKKESFQPTGIRYIYKNKFEEIY